MGSTNHRPALLTVLGITFLTTVGCFAGAEQAETPEGTTVASAEATRVEVVTLEVSDARLELELPGEVRGWRDAQLAAANGGYVESVHAAAGDQVSRGDRLVSVDVSTFAAQAEQANARAEQAVRELERLEQIGDLTTDQQLLQARTNARVAEADRRQARARLSRAVIAAPFDGVVAELPVEVGEVTGPGSTVARLVQLDPVKVVLQVSDRDVGRLAVGEPVGVWSGATAEWREGRIAVVSPAANLNTRAFPVEVEVPNPDGRMLPGMIARVRVERVLDDRQVVIPQDWLVMRRRAQGVFIERDGKAVWRPVSLGEVAHDDVIVLDGLAPGDRVVMTGHRELVDGDPLIVSRVGRCCAAGRPVFE